VCRRTPKLDEGKFKPKFFWAMAVWNYAAKGCSGARNHSGQPIEELLVNSDWGDPREYDLTINKKGEGLETEYSARHHRRSQCRKKLSHS
jgi:hypothetical protein